MITRFISACLLSATAYLVYYLLIHHMLNWVPWPFDLMCGFYLLIGFTLPTLGVGNVTDLRRRWSIILGLSMLASTSSFALAPFVFSKAGFTLTAWVLHTWGALSGLALLLTVHLALLWLLNRKNSTAPT